MIETDVFVSAACVNSLQKCDVDDTLIEYDKARKLLYFLLQSSIANYENFVACLKKTKQRLVAKIIENDVGELIAQVNRYLKTNPFAERYCSSIDCLLSMLMLLLSFTVR